MNARNTIWDKIKQTKKAVVEGETQPNKSGIKKAPLER